ncbi:MAG: hypothetical protein L6Q37_11730 [Bdellovibrionaceae bacterium]|nr:hypothetical protein [Pseudobdellovibrionaceae bacterium]NUM57259.1 hypothetical protein [Pseudobdellovibrionaceae bacterium]
MLLLTTRAKAEYRVFLLKISQLEVGNAMGEETTSRLVTSTLDPLQYRGYYTLKENEVISYVDTWMCKGRTNSLPLCENPRSKSIEQP